jgi:hypothetical protein
MAIMTLVEYKKLSQDPVQQFVINEFLNSRLLQVLPFMDVAGGGYFYNKMTKLPGVGFRGVNESFASDIGIVNPESEALKLLGGDIKVDVAMIDRYGAERRAVEIQGAIEAARLTFEKTFFKGDSSISPEEFDGLQKRVTGNQLITNGADGTGNALSIESLKETIDAVKAGAGRKLLAMNETIMRRLEGYYEATANGMLRMQVNELGQEVMTYRGCEIVIIEDDEDGNAILPFTEASPDGSTSANNTSVYCMRVGPRLVTGIQGTSNGVNGIYAEDFGRIESEPKLLTRVQWDCGFVVENGRSVARLHGIQDAAAVA